MKQIPQIKRLARTSIAGTVLFTLPGLLAGQPTVDVADFLLTEPGRSWTMTGEALYSGFNLALTMDLTTEPGEVLHGVQTTRIKMDASGSMLFISARVVQEIQVSLSGDALRLHSRTGQVYLNGELDDEDLEVYLTPASILPRLITVGQSYPFLAELESGDQNDSVLVESIETIQTTLGAVDTIKLVAFTEDEVPVTLWLGRDVGYMKVQVDTTVDESPLVVAARLQSTDIPWNPMDIATLWGDTLNNGNGWRYANWLGHFWAGGSDSPWINHFGLNWAYCLGDSSSLWMYLLGNDGWLWTSSSYYPVFYNAVNRHFLLHTAGSPWFWDYNLGDWVNLGG